MDIQAYFRNILADEQIDAEFLHLTSNEPLVSKTARTFVNSPLADRYFLGGGDADGIIYSGSFTTLGLPGVAKLVAAAEAAAQDMLNAAIVNLNCLSGVHAMMCALLSTTEPGDTVMTVHHDHGGHFATQGIVERIGRRHVSTEYDFESSSFQAEALAKIFHDVKAKALYLDVSYYLNPHNIRELRAALGEAAVIIYDASHTMGLIMGGQFQSPLAEGVDLICANTHKTLPGPQKGMIAFRDGELGRRANGIINACLYSSPHTAGVIALAVTILEMQEFGHDYARQIVANSNALGAELEQLGHKVFRGNTGRYSENHQVHLSVASNSKTLYPQFFRNRINVNFDNPGILQRGEFIRLGTQEITRRGMKEPEMKQIAAFLGASLRGEACAEEVTAFAARFRLVYYSFDQE
ncbi:MAG TPA: hypothetical protein VI322_03045 [Candidatus Saccharimonadia bacterium]